MQVVITDCDHGNVDPERQVLEPAGIGVELAQTADPDEIARIAAGARALIVQYAPIGPEVMDRCPDLRVIARYGVGVDTIDIPAASARNIAVCNVTGYCTDEVADQALALMMATLRKVALHDRRIRAGNWDFRLGGPIRRDPRADAGHSGLRSDRRGAGAARPRPGHADHCPRPLSRQLARLDRTDRT